MQAGRMKYMLELLQPTVQKDSTGGEVVTYSPTRTVHAERVKISGRRVVDAAEQFADYSVEWIIRDVHKVAENWRVRQLGGLLYVVTNVVPNIDRGYNLLKCERVNE